MGGPDDDVRPGDARTPSAPGDPVRVVVLTRTGCHLCAVALRTVAEVAAGVGVGWEERDVDVEPALQARYSDQVPVTFVDGRQHDFWRVDENRLRAALERPPPDLR
jgi:glutaredoxin